MAKDKLCRHPAFGYALLEAHSDKLPAPALPLQFCDL